MKGKAKLLGFHSLLFPCYGTFISQQWIVTKEITLIFHFCITVHYILVKLNRIYWLLVVLLLLRDGYQFYYVVHYMKYLIYLNKHSTYSSPSFWSYFVHIHWMSVCCQFQHPNMSMLRLTQALLKSINTILTRLFARSRCSYMLFIKVSSVSSTPLTAWHANWFGSKNGETSHKSRFRIFFSKHYIAVDVRATRDRSLSYLGFFFSFFFFLVTGMISDFFP